MALLAGFCRTTHGAAAPGSSQQMPVLRIVARQQRWRPPGRSAQSLPPHAPHDGAQQMPAYSAFSYLLREGALVRGAAERAGYYNLDASDGGGELGDITRREAVRWGVLPLGTRQLGAG